MKNCQNTRLAVPSSMWTAAAVRCQERNGAARDSRMLDDQGKSVRLDEADAGAWRVVEDRNFRTAREEDAGYVPSIGRPSEPIRR